MTKLSLEETLIEVWRQALVENAKAVKAGRESNPVRRTPKRCLRQVDFTFDENEIRNLVVHLISYAHFCRYRTFYWNKCYACPSKQGAAKRMGHPKRSRLPH